MGLGATLITFSPNTVISSHDVNQNFTNLNAAANPAFTSLTVQNDPTMPTGHQESRFCGKEYSAQAANDVDAYAVPFALKMTNSPSSITLTVNIQLNMRTTYPLVLATTTTGFMLTLEAAAAGSAYWEGNYTTVGNCLLTVDRQAQTFDHHCDGCAPDVAVRRGLPLTALAVNQEHHNRISLQYICPACGTSEHFTTTLTAQDESDSTPQGSGAYRTTRGAQATLIRQLLALLGLPQA